MSEPTKFQKTVDYLNGDFQALWHALEQSTDPHRGNFVFANLCGIFANAVGSMFKTPLELENELVKINPAYKGLSVELVNYLNSPAKLWNEAPLESRENKEELGVTGVPLPGNQLPGRKIRHLTVVDGRFIFEPQVFWNDLMLVVLRRGLLDKPE